MKENYKYPRWINTLASFVIAAIIVVAALSARNQLVWLAGIAVGAFVASFGKDWLNEIYDQN